MKRYFAALALLLPLTLPAAITDQNQFEAAVKKAFNERSPAQLEALTYMEGLSDRDKQVARRLWQSVLTGLEVDNVSFAPLPENYQPFKVAGGMKYEPSYAPSGLLNIQFASSYGEGETMTSPYAIINGSYYLVGTKSSEIKWSGPPDVPVGYSVFGPGEENVTVRVQWNQSGIDQEETFHKSSALVSGQDISSIIVTSTSPDTNVTLTVRRDGKDIYKSQPMKGVGKFEYKK